MGQNLQTHLSQYQRRIRRLRLYVAMFLVLLLLPLSAIVYYGYQQMEYELYFEYRWRAANIVEQVNKTIAERLAPEKRRAVNDYQFYTVVENSMMASPTKTISPLAELNNGMAIKGLVGYFQIDERGGISSPLLPDNHEEMAAAGKLKSDEVATRVARVQQITNIVKQADLSGFLPFNTGNTKSDSIRVSDFSLYSQLPQVLVFYRQVLKGEERLLQGFIVDKQVFLVDLVKSHLGMTRFDTTIEMVLRQETKQQPQQYFFTCRLENNNPVVAQGEQPNGDRHNTRLYQDNLAAPFLQTSLHFSTEQLPLGPATTFISVFLFILMLVIVLGCFGFYWLGRKQIDLIEQRMNFVSAVSHELKTPLTSILMYADMLRQNMVTDSTVTQEYQEFIYEESERLSRLINNVLQLSRLSHQQYQVDLNFISVDQVIDHIRSKTSTLVTKNQFRLNFDNQLNDCETLVLIDHDAFSQVIINLVDNAIKFFLAEHIDEPSRQKIDLSFHQTDQNTVMLTVRDYGPGISAEQEQKIFELFYRGGSELTRTTSGTGIGLALAHELMQAQQGKLSVERHRIGVAFILTFEAKSSSTLEN